MTRQRLVFYALIGGAVGATVVLVGWRILARRLLRVQPVAADSVQHCLESTPDARYADAIDKARQQVLAMMRERRIPGMSITVAVDRRVVWSEGFGFADVDQRRPACPDTRFRIASVSKTITSAAMAKLYDEGRLDLDAPIRRYVPTFPDKGLVTARQLASHRAGIRHYRDDNEAFTTRHFTNVLESLELFQNDSLLFPPGTDHHYSSFGYVLLSAVIQEAAKQEFGAYLEQHVFKRLKLEHTSLERSDAPAPGLAGLAGLARFYDHVTPYVTDGQVHPSPFVDMTSKWAGGGMLSTTEDLVRFGSALLPDSPTALLRAETRQMLFTPLTRARPPIFGYALGWMTMRDVDLRRVYMHFGAGSGATAWLGIFPDQRVVIAVLANLGHAGFTYASTVGLGSRFAPQPLAPAALVTAVSFAAFAVATLVVIQLVQLVKRRLGSGAQLS